MRYIAHNGKWIPENEHRRNQGHSSRTLYFSIFKSEYNPGLGQYVGSRGDIRAACDRIESETGSRPVEMGTESGKVNPKFKEISVPRGAVDAIRARNGRKS